jgi:hypothetical protein
MFLLLYISPHCQDLGIGYGSKVELLMISCCDTEKVLVISIAIKKQVLPLIEITGMDSKCSRSKLYGLIYN